jgi:DNA-binding MarR family transcriptional regulator
MDDLEKKAYVFASIFTLSNRLQVLGDAFDKNVTIKQWLFLVCVSKFPQPPMISEVAGFIGSSRQNAKRIAQALAENGWISIARDKNDTRVLRIEITQKCKDYFNGRWQKEKDFLDELFSAFDAALIDGLYKGLQMLANNIEKIEKKNEIVEE